MLTSQAGRLSPSYAPLWRRLLLLLCLLLSGGQATASAPALVLDGPIGLTRLEPHVSYFCDPSGKLSLADIQSRSLAPLTYSSISFGNRRDVCWFHFTLPCLC